MNHHVSGNARKGHNVWKRDKASVLTVHIQEGVCRQGGSILHGWACKLHIKMYEAHSLTAIGKGV